MLNLERGFPYALGLYRIALGLLFGSHGLTSLFGVFGISQVAVGTWPYWWAALIELVGGTLIVLGLFTRLAALVCSGAMAYAYFTVHMPEDLLPLANGGESAALFCWSFFLLVFAGPGVWALDTVFRGRRSRDGH